MLVRHSIVLIRLNLSLKRKKGRDSGKDQNDDVVIAKLVHHTFTTVPSHVGTQHSRNYATGTLTCSLIFTLASPEIRDLTATRLTV